MSKKLAISYICYIFALILVCFIYRAHLTDAMYNKQEATAEITAEITEQMPETIPVRIPEQETEPELITLGNFRLTAYCPCYDCSGQWGNKTSTGVIAKEGRTIAVDPKIIPYGTQIVINGHTYTAEDCGGDIKGKRADIFFNSHADADNFGVQYADVYAFNVSVCNE